MNIIELDIADNKFIPKSGEGLVHLSYLRKLKSAKYFTYIY